MGNSATVRRIHEHVATAFYPLTIAVVCGTLLAVQHYLETKFAVFGLYALFGLVVGALVYYGTDETATLPARHVDERLTGTGVWVTSAATVGLVALSGEPRLLVVGLAIGYALVVYELFADPTPERVLFHITALFLLSPITKYLTAGRYLGHGDVMNHTRFVDDILASGSVQALSYTGYRDFPGLQLVAGTAGSLSGLSPYDGLMMAGLAAYAVAIPAVYLVVARLTDDSRLGLYTAFAVALLDDVSFFASYVFPQSIAIVLILVLAVLATLVSRDALARRSALVFVALVVALSVTHHLTQVLFAPVIALGLVLYAIQGRNQARAALLNRGCWLFVVGLVVTGIRLVRTGFVDRLVASGVEVVRGGAFGGYTQSPTLGFGRPEWTTSVATAVEWLVGPYGLYLILLVCVFSLGIVGYVRRSTRSPALVAVFWTGIFGSLLVFETPLSVQSLVRISSPWLFVVAFVVAIGLQQLRQRTGSAGRRRVIVALVVVLATLTPVVTADNYYDFDTRSTIQTSLSDQEVTELQALSGYTSESDVSPTTLWLTRLAVERYTGQGPNHVRIADDRVVIPAGHFVYRTRWPGHKVHFVGHAHEGAYSNRLYVASAWLDQRIERGNKVYTAGGVGITWRPVDRPFARL